jgi:hypothetical protein
MRASIVALVIVWLAVPAAGAARAQPAGAEPLVARLEAIDASLGAALVVVRTGTLPRRFAETIVSIDRDVAALGHALPKLGSGPARGSVAYYGLRRADTKLAMARKHIAADEAGGAEAVWSAGGDLEIVADELRRQAALAGLTRRFRALAGRVVAVADARAMDDRSVRALMMAKDGLLRDLPAVAGVPFGTFYAMSGVLHARLGHALRTTRHNEPEAARNDLVSARQATRALAAAFRRG